LIFIILGKCSKKKKKIYFAFVVNSYAILVQKRQSYFPTSGIISTARTSTSGVGLLDNPHSEHDDD
jgi:hypothetical protein